ncbi:DUF5955 family protein [Streptomyces sp. NPDC050509]|uniref:DUF5955 family protein n=1 Tax=Streptomyces sp. NPDC050509 TaxID=3365620 RepID=UPI00379969D7
MLRSVGKSPVAEKGEDPRITGLRAAVSRLRRELAVYPSEFRDRAIAEDELAALAAMVASGAPENARMRRSLLLIVGSIGSVSALGPALMGVRSAVDLFGDLPRPR